MSEPIPTSQDLTENNDANFWGDLLDEQEFRITNLHKQLNWEKYMEWGLTALKAQKNDDSAKSLLPTILAADKEMKKIIDEIALIYLTQPVIRHFLFRATNKSKELNSMVTDKT